MAGEVLKQRREELGGDLKKIAEHLKIRAEYLAAIEDDQFGKLPVAVYTKGYIRSYAGYLGVDAEPIIGFYNQHLSYPQPSAIIPVAAARRKTPLVFLVIPIALLAAAAAGTILYLNTRDSGQVTEPLQSIPAPQPSPVPQTPVAVSPPPEVESPAPVSAPAQPREHTVVLTAKETTWVRISFQDGKSEEALLRRGEEKKWTFADTVVLRIGNAGGVRVQLDGGEQIVPGSAGQVLTMMLPQP